MKFWRQKLQSCVLDWNFWRQNFVKNVHVKRLWNWPQMGFVSANAKTHFSISFYSFYSVYFPSKLNFFAKYISRLIKTSNCETVNKVSVTLGNNGRNTWRCRGISCHWDHHWTPKIHLQREGVNLTNILLAAFYKECFMKGDDYFQVEFVHF